MADPMAITPRRLSKLVTGQSGASNHTKINSGRGFAWIPLGELTALACGRGGELVAPSPRIQPPLQPFWPNRPLTP